jgi:hypothetical protein
MPPSTPDALMLLWSQADPTPQDGQQEGSAYTLGDWEAGGTLTDCLGAGKAAAAGQRPCFSPAAKCPLGAGRVLLVSCRRVQAGARAGWLGALFQSSQSCWILWPIQADGPI